jgi:fructose-bisphosphate aldolase class II
MALVSAKEMLQKARKEGYGVAQININNLEWTKSALSVAQELNSPIILGVSEGAAKYMGGFRTVVAIVTELINNYGYTVPVAIHLDHGSYEGSFKALEAGFTSIMFDGSHYPIDENVEKTKAVLKACHAKGVSVEAEVGGIGGEEDGVVSTGEQANVEECRLVASLGVDLFAAGIGNIHGTYPANWAGLNFDLLKEISDVTGGVPLVLHGGTGIPEDQVLRAISLGVSKINVNTECQLAFAAATRKYIEEGKDKLGKGFDPRKLLAPGAEAIKQVVREKLTMFGSVNKA